MDSFSKLPTELLFSIVDCMHKSDILALRLVSKRFCMDIHDHVLEHFFSHRHHMDISSSLLVLFKISECPHLRRRLRTITIWATRPQFHESVARQDLDQAAQLTKHIPPEFPHYSQLLSARLDGCIDVKHPSLDLLISVLKNLSKAGTLQAFTIRSHHNVNADLGNTEAYGYRSVKHATLCLKSPVYLMPLLRIESVALALMALAEAPCPLSVLDISGSPGSWSWGFESCFTSETIQLINSLRSPSWSCLQKLSIALDTELGMPGHTELQPLGCWLRRLHGLKELEIFLLSNYDAPLKKEHCSHLIAWMEPMQLIELKLANTDIFLDGLVDLIKAQKATLRRLYLRDIRLKEPDRWTSAFTWLADELQLDFIRLRDLWHGRNEMMGGPKPGDEFRGRYSFDGADVVKDGLELLAQKATFFAYNDIDDQY